MKNFLWTGGGVKAVNIDNLPKEAWTIIQGGDLDPLELVRRYEDVAWLGTGIDYVSNAIANLPYVWVRGGDETDEEPEFPFDLNLPLVLNMATAWLYIYAAAYFWKGKNVMGRSMMLRPFHPSSVTPQFDKKAGLTGFKRTIQGGTSDEYEAEEVVHIWEPPRKNEIGPGSPRAKRALHAAGILHNMDSMTTGFFERGAIWPTIISVIDSMPESGVIKEVAASIRRAIGGGVKTAYGIEGINKEVKINQLGSPLKELAMPELTDKKREDISTALGVPQSVLFGNSANFATARQDDLHFYDKTVRPYARMIEGALNTQLFSEFDVELKFKPEELELYQALEAEKADKLINLVYAGIIDKNEARLQMGFEPRDDMEPEPPSPAQLPANVVEGQARDVTPTPRQEEIGKWRRMAAKRFDEGKPEKALAFESDVLPPTLMDWVRGGLEIAQTADDAEAVFEGLEAWEGYP